MENTLSIVFGCEQCRQCEVKEQEAQFEYNLKLLEVIVKKSLGKAPPRIQLALLRLQCYQFNAGNKAGKSIHIAQLYIGTSHLTLGEQEGVYWLLSLKDKCPK